MQEMDKARGTIATLATTNESTRRSKSPRMPTRAKGTKGVNDTDQGRKDSLEKRTLSASQTAEAPESLRYPESRRSTSEDSVTQKETKLSEKRIEFVTRRQYNGTIDDERLHRNRRRRRRQRMSDMDMRLGYFGLGLHDQMEIPEADKLLEVVDQIEGRSAKILLDTGCSTYMLSSSFAKRNGIQGIQMRS